MGTETTFLELPFANLKIDKRKVPDGDGNINLYSLLFFLIIDKRKVPDGDGNSSSHISPPKVKK